jgi:hypothetical protein
MVYCRISLDTGYVSGIATGDGLENMVEAAILHRGVWWVYKNEIAFGQAPRDPIGVAYPR